VKYLTHPWRVGVVQSSRREASSSLSLSDEVEEQMYASVSVAKKSSEDFTVVMMFSLLGLAISLLAIGKAGLIDPEYLATLLASF
jgi:hypothetical protein